MQNRCCRPPLTTNPETFPYNSVAKVTWSIVIVQARLFLDQAPWSLRIISATVICLPPTGLTAVAFSSCLNLLWSASLQTSHGVVRAPKFIEIMTKGRDFKMKLSLAIMLVIMAYILQSQNTVSQHWWREQERPHLRWDDQRRLRL